MSEECKNKVLPQATQHKHMAVMERGTISFYYSMGDFEPSRLVSIQYASSQSSVICQSFCSCPVVMISNDTDTVALYSMGM
jgi:hypothetical protein